MRLPESRCVNAIRVDCKGYAKRAAERITLEAALRLPDSRTPADISNPSPH